MKDFSILALRITLGIGLLSAVADRFGLWGNFGETAVAWGNWNNFVDYTSILNFNISKPYATVLASIATIAEIILAILLIIGYKLKHVAKLTALLLFAFGLMMSVNTNLKYALDYSVFVGCFASLLLSFQENYKWSLDEFLLSKNKN